MSAFDPKQTLFCFRQREKAFRRKPGRGRPPLLVAARQRACLSALVSATFRVFDAITARYPLTPTSNFAEKWPTPRHRSRQKALEILPALPRQRLGRTARDPRCEVGGEGARASRRERGMMMAAKAKGRPCRQSRHPTRTDECLLSGVKQT